VLPFTADPGDPAAASRGNSMASELAGHLCRFRELRVVSPASLPTGAARRRELAQADFVIAGTLASTGRRIRVRLAVYRAATGRRLWSDRRTVDPAKFADAAASDCQILAGRLVSLLRHAMVGGGEAFGPDQQESAPCLIARGFALCEAPRREAVELAAALFRKALSRAPNASRALSGLARTCSLAWLFGWSSAPERLLDRAVWLAQQAVDRDPADAGSWAELAWVRLHRQEHDAARAAFGRALDLNPNDPDILARYAAMLHGEGEAAAALATIRRAIQLNPLQPDFYLWALAAIHDEAGRFKAASLAIRRMRDPELGRRLLALSYAKLGLLERARTQSRCVLGLAPYASAAPLTSAMPATGAICQT
jgi:tetratricopeptide (TPR) repeat protein